MNPMDLRRGIQLGVDAINTELAAMSVPVQGKEAI
jgi:chaperonin GroEL (HSP60 family)